MIDFYIIHSPERSIEDLRRKLGEIENTKVFIIPGKFLRSDQNLEKEYDAARAKLLNGRNLTIGEIGCAMAHNICRSKAQLSSNLSIILEDDVGIYKMSLLKKFLELADKSVSITDNLVINLAGESSAKENLPKFPKSDSSWRKTFGATPLAAAYLLTPKSAGVLLKNNTPVTNVADWPPTDIKFYKSRHALFIHQENKSKSLISDKKGNGRRGFSRIDLMGIYIGIYFLRQKKQFLGFKDFYFNLWLPRMKAMITHRIKI
jgi:hypothetical protein